MPVRESEMAILQHLLGGAGLSNTPSVLSLDASLRLA
jgi:hypothetical protein